MLLVYHTLIVAKSADHRYAMNLFTILPDICSKEYLVVSQRGFGSTKASGRDTGRGERSKTSLGQAQSAVLNERRQKRTLSASTELLSL
ncbi:hypothetical protein EBS02_10030 [bacterium]|nr:hypothetical protein [bacterium]